MVLSLVDLVKHDSNQSSTVNSLIEKLYQHPQLPRYLTPCQHQSKRYENITPQANEVACIASTILQRQFEPFLISKHIRNVETNEQLFGYDTSF